MAPRNNDASTSFKKKSCPVESESEVDIKDIVPCLLHKKHKVVKLVKSQLQKIHEDGLLCDMEGLDSEVYHMEDERAGGGRVRTETLSYASKPGPSKNLGRLRAGEEADMNRRERTGGFCLCFYLLAFVLALFLLIFIMVWVSAGPLSNSMAHTPIPVGSFVRTDGLCSLEKKYLLRWSKPEYFE